MQTEKVTLVKVNHFCVDCEKNDEVDINCGGPDYIGYDFFVDYDIEKKDVIALIEKELKKYKQPLLRSIRTHKQQIRISSLWSLDKIKKCIKDGYN